MRLCAGHDGGCTGVLGHRTRYVETEQGTERAGEGRVRDAQEESLLLLLLLLLLLSHLTDILVALPLCLSHAHSERELQGRSQDLVAEHLIIGTFLLAHKLAVPSGGTSAS